MTVQEVHSRAAIPAVGARPRRMRGVPGGAVTGPAIWAAAKLRVATWDRLAAAPEAVQTRTLLQHCARGARTEFGKQHRLGSVRRWEDFRDRVPVRTYADFEPLLERMRRGDRNVLHPDFIRYYGCSSGTSHTRAKNKYLPISREQIKWQQKAGFDVVARYLALTGDREWSAGFSLALLPPAVIKPEGPVGVTSNPGLMQLHMPRVASLMSLPRPPLRDIEDYDRKLDAIADAYLDHDVRSMSGTTCWFPNLFERLLVQARRRGMQAETVRDVWPNLRVLFGGGVYAEPYRDIIESRVGGPIPLMDNYNATEGGIFAVTDRLDGPGLRMIPDRGVFFEFVPREQQGRPDAERVPLWRVEKGGEYAVIVTTCSGLYAYDIGDLVRFTDLFPHRIEFIGRSAGMLSVTQELMTTLEVERAVGAAVKLADCSIVEFACGADIGGRGGGKGWYVLFAEFERPPGDLEGFRVAFDAALGEQNRVYREHRENDAAILSPEIVTLPRGTMKQFVELVGRSGAQQKFPRILDDAKRDVLRRLARESLH